MIKAPVLIRDGVQLLANYISVAIDTSINDTPKGTIKLGPSVDGVIPRIHDFVWIQSDHDDGGMYRIVSITGDMIKGYTCQIMGAIDTFTDALYEVDGDEITKSATAWIQDVIARQPVQYWRYGRCELDEDVRIKPGYQSLADILTVVQEYRPDYKWMFNFGTTPWLLSLVHAGTTPACGFSLARNVESIQVQRTDDDFYNRLIFTVSDTDPVSTNTYNDTASQGLYGLCTRAVSVKQDDIPSGMSAAQYAQELLTLHATPGYSIQVSGADLLALTGESFDWIKLGAKCVVQTPDAGKIIETVVSISWPDALNQPERIRVSLASEMPKVTAGIASAIKVADVLRTTSRGGRGGGGGKTQKDSTYWAKILTDTIEASEGAGLQQLWQSGIEVGARTGVRIFSLYQGMEALDSEIIVNTGRISAEVTRATAEEGRLSGRIQVNADNITAEVTRATTAEGQLSGRIQVNADNISAEVSRANAEEGRLSGLIQVNADNIALKVSKGNVSTQLSVEMGNVSISNGNLIVDGYVTASQLNAVSGRIDSILSGNTDVTNLRATNASLGSEHGGTVKFYGQIVRIYTVVDTSGTTRYLYGYR